MQRLWVCVDVFVLLQTAEYYVIFRGRFLNVLVCIPPQGELLQWRCGGLVDSQPQAFCHLSYYAQSKGF